MNILKKPILWMVVGGILFVALIFILIPATFPTENTTSESEAREVFSDFKDRIRFTRAGQHYQELISRHSDELDEIYNEHADHEQHRANLLQLMRVFKPVMQDVIEGDGNTVQITREQIDLLQAELDWIAQQGSPALRRDVEEEWQHLPLETLVGMTFNEALDFLEADMPPEFVAGPILPTATPTLPPQPTATFINPVCLAGLDPDCLAEPSIVQDSDGTWAYIILDEIYVEYPADWRAESPGTSGTTEVYFIPSQDPLTGLRDRSAYIQIKNNTDSEFIPQPENPLWEEQLSLRDFEGPAFMYELTDGAYTLQAFLHNEVQQRSVHFVLSVFNAQNAPLTFTPEIIANNVSFFKHMAESVKIWGQGQPLPPTAVGTSIVPDVAPQLATEWTHEILNGVYFEYPADWFVQKQGDARIFVTAPGSFEAINTRETILGVSKNIVIPQDVQLDQLSCSPDPSVEQPPSIWREKMVLDDFEGRQLLWKGRGIDGEVVYLDVVLYNRDHQTMVCVAMIIDPYMLDEWNDSLDILLQKLPNFYHMLESIRIENE
jgi:hypothetical protein